MQNLNALESIIGPTVEQLQQELDETFPPVNPTPDNNINMIMYKAGQRSVVEWYIQRLSKTDVSI